MGGGGADQPNGEKKREGVDSLKEVNAYEIFLIGATVQWEMGKKGQAKLYIFQFLKREAQKWYIMPMSAGLM